MQNYCLLLSKIKCIHTVVFMKNRIRELMEMDGLNATEFSKKVKINSSVVSNILNAKNQPSFDVIQKIIAAYPEVDIAWLMTGHGDLFGEESSESASEELENAADAEVSLFHDASFISPNPAQASENALQPNPSTVLDRNTKEKGRKRPSRPIQNIDNQESIIEEKPKKSIRKIIIVYQDNTFEEILPKEN